MRKLQVGDGPERDLWPVFGKADSLIGCCSGWLAADKPDCVIHFPPRLWSYQFLRRVTPLAVTISNLSKTYPNGVKALKNISLQIGNNMFGLLGPNGAGRAL